MTMKISIVMAIWRNSFHYPLLRLPAGAGIASVFSQMVANRIAPDTHRDQAIGDELSTALAAPPP
ncbi:UNVERIFIED_ORG: hypothetical protein BDU10_5333 [Burkholderia sp. CF145]|jgi:hypothetical protein|uniref:hypothetical protein n=1 Tax=Paraburkholderia hospita TaxID=169430 RepID=UPI000271BF07|nr:hypothetical protein [Paraburkholderia hospita]EUC18593.1 hypothetical protein PMI06_003330 [Burkholderia sp. BT03]SKC58831.1 hypothetical protein SAMN06266956_1002 [Paraburkholderia hospita]